MSTAIASVRIDGEIVATDLGRKRTRLLIEAAALYAIPDAEVVENLPGIGDRPQY